MHHRDIPTHPRRAPRATRPVAVAATLALTAALALAAGAADASSRTTVRVDASRNAHLHETILVNAAGRTLYRFRPETAGHIMCTGACAQLWPPLLVPSHGARLLAGGGVHGRLTIVRRPDGKRQAAFDGHPLYTFAHDRRAGDVKGQGFGGAWFVLAQPTAHHAKARARASARAGAAASANANAIPQHNRGDMDGDNNGAPSDGDGNI